MRPKPPGHNRPDSSRVSVDLAAVLRELFELLGADSSSETPYGQPGEYGSPSWGCDSSFGSAVKYLQQEIMSKFDDGDKSSDEQKTSKALERFDEAEALCATTNRRFAKYFLGHRPLEEDVSRTICRAREKIWRLLGEDVPYDEVAQGFSFTNGGSVKLPRANGSSVHKYSSALETTELNLLALQPALQAIPLWEASNAEGPGIDVLPGNKLLCVPKNYKVHRVIAGEPSGNMYLQKGIHAVLRKRLKSVGIDLSNQTTNQDWALFGSVTGAVATVDMSMASDTVSYTVVEWFVPESWFRLMHMCRSPVGQFSSGKKVLYRKFSSMGNADTFEIETLLFWALARASCEIVGADGRFVGVYGDDVIIPTRACELFLRVLAECGFKPNEKKTFVSGHFRESCGKHYLNGEDVTPFYIRKPVKSLPDLFLLVNNLERWRRRVKKLRDFPVELHEPLKAFVQKLRDFAPRDWRRPRIPDGKGDGAFIGTFDECLPSKPHGKRRHFGGWQVEVLIEKHDNAIGIIYDTNGKPRPLTLTPKGKRRVGDYCKSVDGVTLVGFLLSKLEEAEKVDRAWYEITQRDISLKNVAMTFLRNDPESGGRGVALPSTKRWEVATVLIPELGLGKTKHERWERQTIVVPQMD